jgi:hypothetical protein
MGASKLKRKPQPVPCRGCGVTPEVVWQPKPRRWLIGCDCCSGPVGYDGFSFPAHLRDQMVIHWNAWQKVRRL